MEPGRCRAADRAGRPDRIALGRYGRTAPGQPKIRIVPVELPRSYDEHNWKILNDRWDSYRAQMNGEVFGPAEFTGQASYEVTEAVRAATPDFSPLLSHCP